MEQGNYGAGVQFAPRKGVQMPLIRDPEKLYIGYHCSTTEKKCLDRAAVDTILSVANMRGFDFVCLPAALENNSNENLIHNKLLVSPAVGDVEGYSFCPSVESDLVMNSASWMNSIVLVISSWMTPGGHSLEEDRRWENPLEQQLDWANHCSAYGTIIPTPSVSSIVPYAGFIARYMADSTSTRLWVRIPLSVMQDGIEVDGWDIWNHLRQSVGISTVGVALVMTELHSFSDVSLDRWMAEPVHVVVIPTSWLELSGAWTIRDLGLPKKRFLEKLMRQKVQLIIDDGIGDYAAMCSPVTVACVSSISRVFHEITPLTEVGKKLIYVNIGGYCCC